MSPPDVLLHPKFSSAYARKEARTPAQTPGELESRLASLKAEIDALGEDTVFDLPKTADFSRDNVDAPRAFWISDSIALVLSFVLSWVVSDAINLTFFNRQVSDFWAGGESFRPFELLLVISSVLVWFEHEGHYRLRLSFWKETQKIVSVLSMAMILDGFFQFVSKADFSRLWLMSGWGFAMAGMIFGRWAMRKILRARGKWQVRTLLVGAGPQAEELRETLEDESALGYEIVHQIDNFAQAWVQAGASWRRLCGAYNASYVILAHEGGAKGPSPEALSAITREDIPFSVVPVMSSLPVVGMEAQSFFYHDVLMLCRSNNLEQPLPRWLKRSMDVVLASVTLIVLSPVLAGLALAVRLDGGRAFFGHARMGVGGRRFLCWKFRTMVPNGDEVLARHLLAHADARSEWLRDRKLRDDPRVTRLGAFLRRLSLDELPQLWNVIKGDMSLVGPRPIVLSEVPRYEGDIAHYCRVRPGVTGLWQISGRNDVSYDERVQMDSWYVRNWSLWGDVVILFKTIPALFRKTGAY